jgi:hypothetical protein
MEVSFGISRLRLHKRRRIFSGRDFDIATAMARANPKAPAGLPCSDEQKKTRLRSHLSA